MVLSQVDIVFVVISTLLLLVGNYLKPSLRRTLLVKDSRQRIIFSINKDKALWLILGLGSYVWIMEFLILNSAVTLRLITPSLFQVALFLGLIIPNLGYPKLGKGTSLVGLIIFIVSILYLV